MKQGNAEKQRNKEAGKSRKNRNLVPSEKQAGKEAESRRKELGKNKKAKMQGKINPREIPRLDGTK